MRKVKFMQDAVTERLG
jgi:nucleolar GTP-binding protein